MICIVITLQQAVSFCSLGLNAYAETQIICFLAKLLDYNWGDVITSMCLVKLGVNVVQSSIKYLLLLVLILISQTVLAQETAEVRLVWNQEILVVINTSGEDVNVSNLELVNVDSWHIWKV